MKILQISDTHNKHQKLTNLPTADVIVHCGDFTEQGTEEEVLDFLNWFIELPFKHKIFITGMVKSEQAHPLGDGENHSLEAKNDRNRADKTEHIRSKVANPS